MSHEIIIEARRQLEICNACRYCEGYCSVFPAITRKRVFSDGDVTQLANLCHNCRGCYYACQYTEPHEFDLNVPAALAEVRTQSWEQFSWPGGFARLFQRNGMAVLAVLVAAFAMMLGVASEFGPDGGEGFYGVLSHNTLVALFVPAFGLPLMVVFVGLRKYWRHVEGEGICLSHLLAAMLHAAKLKDLSGGQGQGCNFENGDRYSNTRRWFHQAVLYGFVLCFAATTVGTLMHYLFDLRAPYDLISLPKLLGVPGGLLLVVGCAGLAVLKARSVKTLGTVQAWGGEMAFIVLFLLVALTGLGLYAVTGTTLVPMALVLHLATTLILFLLIPYSKMVHGFFRLAALVRDAQTTDK